MSSGHKLTKYKDEEFWTGLRSEDPEKRLTALCEARNAAIGLVAAKCYFASHGIFSILQECLPEHCDTESEVVSQLRLEATLFIGSLVQSIQHARETVGKISVKSLIGQLSLNGRIVAASLTALHHLCISASTRAEVAHHGTDILLAMLRAECGVDSDASDRRTELVAKIVGCVAVEWQPSKTETRLGVLKSLSRLLDEKKRSTVIFACLECAVRVLTSALPENPTREDFAVLTMLQVNRLLPEDHLKLHLTDTFHPPIQVCAAQLLCYKFVVATSWQSNGAGELPFRDCIRRTLLPLLVREAVGGLRTHFSLLGCHCLHVIRLLVRFFRVDAGAIAVRCESFGRLLAEKLQPVFVGTAVGGAGVAWHYAACALRCLTELCSLSEDECVQVSRLPGIKDCILTPLDQRCPSMSAKAAALELTLALSRSVQVCRSLLLEAAAGKAVAEVVELYPVYLEIQSPMLITACSILANMLLPFCSLSNPAIRADVFVRVSELIVILVELPSPDRQWREELLCEALALLRNASFEVVGAFVITPNSYTCSLFDILDARREDFHPSVCLAAIKLIGQFKFVAEQHTEAASNAFRILMSYFYRVAEAGEWEPKYWTLVALRRIVGGGVFAAEVDVDWDVLASAVRSCLQHQQSDVKIQAALYINQLAVTNPHLQSSSRNILIASLGTLIGNVEPHVEVFIVDSLQGLGM